MTMREQVGMWFDYLREAWDSEVCNRHDEVDVEAKAGIFTTSLETIVDGLRYINQTADFKDQLKEYSSDFSELTLTLVDARYDADVGAMEYIPGWQTDIYFPSGNIRTIRCTIRAV